MIRRPQPSPATFALKVARGLVCNALPSLDAMAEANGHNLTIYLEQEVDWIIGKLRHAIAQIDAARVLHEVMLVRQRADKSADQRAALDGGGAV